MRSLPRRERYTREPRVDRARGERSRGRSRRRRRDRARDRRRLEQPRSAGIRREKERGSHRDPRRLVSEYVRRERSLPPARRGGWVGEDPALQLRVGLPAAVSHASARSSLVDAAIAPTLVAGGPVERRPRSVRSRRPAAGDPRSFPRRVLDRPIRPRLLNSPLRPRPRSPAPSREAGASCGRPPAASARYRRP